MNKKSIAAAIALACLTTAASAASNDDDPNAIGPYLGAAYGLSHYSKVDCSGAVSCDNTPEGFKLIGGLPMSKNIALELQYVRYGKGDALFQSGVRGSWEGRHFGVGVASIGNFGQRWTGIARAGLAENKAKLTGSVPGLGSGSISENHVSVYAGGSIGFRVTPQLTVEAGLDLTRFELLDEKVTARQFNLGLRHSF